MPSSPYATVPRPTGVNQPSNPGATSPYASPYTRGGVNDLYQNQVYSPQQTGGYSVPGYGNTSGLLGGDVGTYYPQQTQQPYTGAGANPYGGSPYQPFGGVTGATGIQGLIGAQGPFGPNNPPPPGMPPTGGSILAPSSMGGTGMAGTQLPPGTANYPTASSYPPFQIQPAVGPQGGGIPFGPDYPGLPGFPGGQPGQPTGGGSPYPQGATQAGGYGQSVQLATNPNPSGIPQGGRVVNQGGPYTTPYTGGRQIDTGLIGATLPPGLYQPPGSNQQPGQPDVGDIINQLINQAGGNPIQAFQNAGLPGNPSSPVDNPFLQQNTGVTGATGIQGAIGAQGPFGQNNPPPPGMPGQGMFGVGDGGAGGFQVPGFGGGVGQGLIGGDVGSVVPNYNQPPQSGSPYASLPGGGYSLPGGGYSLPGSGQPGDPNYAGTYVPGNQFSTPMTGYYGTTYNPLSPLQQQGGVTGTTGIQGAIGTQPVQGQNGQLLYPPGGDAMSGASGLDQLLGGSALGQSPTLPNQGIAQGLAQANQQPGGYDYAQLGLNTQGIPFTGQNDYEAYRDQRTANMNERLDAYRQGLVTLEEAQQGGVAGLPPRAQLVNPPANPGYLQVSGNRYNPVVGQQIAQLQNQAAQQQQSSSPYAVPQQQQQQGQGQNPYGYSAFGTSSSQGATGVPAGPNAYDMRTLTGDPNVNPNIAQQQRARQRDQEAIAFQNQPVRVTQGQDGYITSYPQGYGSYLSALQQFLGQQQNYGSYDPYMAFLNQFTNLAV